MLRRGAEAAALARLRPAVVRQLAVAPPVAVAVAAAAEAEAVAVARRR